ncbi:hypothetical protein [Actinotalea fermentans]|uniref:Uncharacterized protein n=1 Tax=Actinotalea fermentans TaxID=43671 RepID=A0A511Z082_9CELL|nr:hypothetical protein [Actinotalea fermentans]GEN80871.1 hypothetical protein AFE02nite_26050 [Actinotalea fermentans]
MFGGVIVIVALGGLLLVVVALGLAAALSRQPVPPPSEAAEAARRHGVLVSIAAWALPSIVGPLLLLQLSDLYLRWGGTGGPATWNALLVGLYPALFGLGYLGVHAIGERTWPRPAGPVRRAALVHRRVSDVAPRWLRRTVNGLAVATVVVLVVCGATGADDGRSITTSAFSGDAFTTRSASPYPGWHFALPLLVAVVLVALAAEGVLRLVARRPAIVDADPTYDAASRRLSAHRALRGAVLVIGCSLAGVLVVAGTALQGVELRPLGLAAAVLGVVVGLGSIVVAAIPGRAAVAAPAAARGPATSPASRSAAA